MGRQADGKRLQEIAGYVGEHPGVRAAEIARELELSRSSVMRALPSLEDQGYLLYEDGRGRLWPFNTRIGR